MSFNRIQNILLNIFLLAAFASLNLATSVSANEHHKSKLNQTPGNEQALTAAAQAFLKRTQLLLIANKADYGFTAEDKLETLKLGSPFELYALNNEKVKSYKKGGNLADSLEKTGHWYVPVLAAANTRALIEVVKDSAGVWSGTGLGWAPLAKKWQKINTYWPKTGKAEPLLIINYIMPGYLFAIPSYPYPNLTSLAKLNDEELTKLGKNKPALDDVPATFAKLQTALKEDKPKID